MAAADIGTNSCRLLVSEVNDGELETLVKKTVSTRLGEGLLKSGWLTPQAIKRTVDCLLDFRDTILEHRATAYRVVATSAVREAANREDFLAVAAGETGLSIEVISGEEEARLSWMGVRNSLALSRPPLVADLGAGSTEFVYPGDPPQVRSARVGAVKATEGDWSRDEIRERLSEAFALGERYQDHPLVLVGGTPTTLVAIKEGLVEYRSALVHGQVLTRGEVAELYTRLESTPLEQRRRLPGLQPERADIILKGVLIVMVIMDGFKKHKITVSESDLLEGIVWQLKEAASDTGRS